MAAMPAADVSFLSSTPAISPGSIIVKRNELVKDPKPPKEPGRRGPKAHFQGEQADYLHSQGPAFQAASDAGTSGEMTLLTARALYSRFGDAAFHDQVAASQEAIPEDDGAAGAVGDESLLTDTQAKADMHAARLSKLSKKLGQWFRRNVISVQVVATAPVATSAANPFASMLTLNTVPAPVRKNLTSYYMSKYYQTRVKVHYDRRWLEVSRAWAATTLEARAIQDLKKPSAVAVRRALAEEIMATESPYFLELLKAENEALYDERREAWESGKTAATTPQEYHHHLQHAAQHILPMVEAVAKLMGASVTIFIVGPIPDSNGVIENRSINVNHPGGLRSQTWAQHDPVGFARAEDSFKAFGMANFTPEECQRRALPYDCEIMVKKREEAAARANLDDRGLLTIEANAASPPHDDPLSFTEPLFSPPPAHRQGDVLPREELSPLLTPSANTIVGQEEDQPALDRSPIHRHPLFFPSPSTRPASPDLNEAVLPPSIPSPIAGLSNRRDLDEDVIMQDSRNSWSPLVQSDLLQSTLGLAQTSAIQPVCREQSDELPLLDQTWSRARKVGLNRGQSQPRSVYRVNRTYDDISNDITAGMLDEEEAIGRLATSPNITSSPSAGRSNHAPTYPFVFAAPSRTLVGTPIATRTRPMMTYARRNRMAQSSPPHIGTYGTQISLRSHSSPSYGLPDSHRYPSLTNLLTKKARNACDGPVGAPLVALLAQDATAVEDDEEAADRDADNEMAGERQEQVGQGAAAAIAGPVPAPIRERQDQVGQGVAAAIAGQVPALIHLSDPIPQIAVSPRTPPPARNRLYTALTENLARKKAKELEVQTSPLSSPLPGSSPPPLSSPLPRSSPPPASSPPAAASPTALEPVSVPDAPDHWCRLLTQTYYYAVANTQAWGEEWLSLVTMVIEFVAPFMENGKYPETTNSPAHAMVRPKEVLHWQQSGRPLDDAVIACMPVFSTMWWAWWSLMQPPARIAHGTSALGESTFSMDWTCLRQPGENGLMLVLMALRWWGVQSNASSEWQEAVADASSAIFCMTDSDEGPRNTEVTKKGVDVFKALLTEGQYAYNKDSTKRKRRPGKSVTTNAIISKASRTSPNHILTQPAVSVRLPPNPPAKKPSQPNVSTQSTNKKHSWEWVPTTSPGATEVDEEETPELSGRETRAQKKQRVG